MQIDVKKGVECNPGCANQPSAPVNGPRKCRTRFELFIHVSGYSLLKDPFGSTGPKYGDAFRISLRARTLRARNLRYSVFEYQWTLVFDPSLKCFQYYSMNSASGSTSVAVIGPLNYKVTKICGTLFSFCKPPNLHSGAVVEGGSDIGRASLIVGISH